MGNELTWLQDRLNGNGKPVVISPLSATRSQGNGKSKDSLNHCVARHSIDRPEITRMPMIR
jgi:hypothetical protein